MLFVVVTGRMVELRLPKRALVTALEGCAQVVPARAANLAAAVRLRYTGSALILSARSEMGVQYEVATDVGLLPPSGTDVAVNAPLLSQLVRLLPDTTVTLVMSEAEVSVSAGQSVFRVSTLSVTNMGELAMISPELEHGPQVLTLMTTDLRRAIEGTRYAASTEAFQAAFRNLNFELERDALHVVASDGFRLAICDLPLPSAAPAQYLVQARHLSDLLKLLGKVDVPVALSWTDSHLIVIAEHVAVTAPLSEKGFPEWRRIVPTDNAIQLKVAVATLKASLDRVRVMTSSTSNFRIEMQVQSTTQAQLAAEGEYGRVVDNLDVEMQSPYGEGFCLAFNAKYLAEALATHEGTLTMMIGKVTTPVLLTSDALGLRSVVMPLRV